MGFVVVGKREAGTQILSQKWLLGLLNILNNGSVHGFLGINSGLGDLLLLKDKG